LYRTTERFPAARVTGAHISIDKNAEHGYTDGVFA